MIKHKRAFAAAGLGALLGLGLAAGAGAQDVTIGVTLSTTGPAAALGVPERNALETVAREIGGRKINVILLDDAGDPTAATTNARRFVAESRADVIIGSSTTPPSIAVGNVANEAGTPHFSLAPMPTQGRETWSVVMPQPVSLMAAAVFEHMRKEKVTTVGLIGFSDSWGDLWVAEFKRQAEPMGLKLVAEERYARADTSVTGQTLKLIAARPDAVLVAGSGTGAALPQVALRDRGYRGRIYQTHGAVTRDFIRIAGKAAEGTVLPAGPPIIAELQPDGSPTKAPGLAHVTAYEAKHGAGSRNQFAAHLFDAFKVLERVIPVALKSAQPGTPEFREAIRQALLTERDIAAAHGVYNFTESDRYGLDQRGRVLLTIKDGDWRLVD